MSGTLTVQDVLIRCEEAIRLVIEQREAHETQLKNELSARVHEVSLQFGDIFVLHLASESVRRR